MRRRLCPNNELAFNTVQTLLRIMDDKGLVSHKRHGRTSSIRPATAGSGPRRDSSRHVFDGAIDQVVLSMIGTADPESEELGKSKRS